MAENFPEYPGWKTVRKIGTGSFGAVYEIERDLIDVKEKAALKVITIPQSEDDVEELYSNGFDDESITSHFYNYLADIVREYKLMSEMKGHTNVVYCDDIRYVQKDNGFGWTIYIKMELLTPMLKSLGNGYSEEETIRLGRDIASALILCRSRNIIHRDIKPQNIFVSKDGDYKLGDFGIAKIAEKTSGGTKIGTYNYMAPEVYNNEPYGHSSDIYSLGLVMYWMMNERRMPFYPLPPEIPKSTDMEQARLKRFRGDPIPAPVNGSENLKRIVLKACAFDPKDRYQSAEELYADLESADSSPSILGADDGTIRFSDIPRADSEPADYEAADNKTRGLWDLNPTEKKNSNKQNDSAPKKSDDDQIDTKPDTVTTDQDFETGKNDEKKEEHGKKKRTLIWVAAALLCVLIAGAVLIPGSNRSRRETNPISSNETQHGETVQSGTADIQSNTNPAGSELLTTENYTQQPADSKGDITLIVPFAAGGQRDLLARKIQNDLAQNLEIEIAVQNDSETGKWDVYRQALETDNGTILVFADYHQLVRAYLDINNNTNVDFQSFINIAKVFHDPCVIAVGSDSPYESLKDLINAGKEQALMISSTGAWGSDDDAVIRLINKACGTKFTEKAFSDDTSARQALEENTVAAQVCNIHFLTNGSSNPDKVRPLAVFDEAASFLLPEIPTIDSTGVQELQGLYISRDLGLIAGKSLSDEMLERVTAALQKITSDSLFIQETAEYGWEVRPVFGENLENYLQNVDSTIRKVAVWSKWLDALPENATADKVDIQTRDAYRSSQLETTTSTVSDKMDGWELYDTQITDAQFSAWSEWSESKPDQKDGREIESSTSYRYSDLETTTSSSSTMPGWTLDGTSSQWGDYGAWSEWSTSQVQATDSREVQTQTRYQYRDREIRTSTSSSLSGWSLYGSGQSWGEWGKWVTTDAPVEDMGESRQIETVEMYRSREKTSVKTYSQAEGGSDIYYTEDEYGDWTEWQTSPIYGSDSLDVETREVQTGTRYLLAHYCTGNINSTVYYWTTPYSPIHLVDHESARLFNENCVYHELGWYDSLDDFYVDHVWDGYSGYRHNGSDLWCANSCFSWYIVDTQDVYTTQYRSRSKTTAYYYWQYSDWGSWSESYPSGAEEVQQKTIYRYRDRSASTVYYFERWGNWSEWSSSAVVQSEDREVNTSQWYRYRDRAIVPVYQFSRWKDWTAWSSAAVTETATRRVQTADVYRYRDAGSTTTYYFRRWSDWSDYSETPVTESETVKVEKITQYRWRIKSK